MLYKKPTEKQYKDYLLSCEESFYYPCETCGYPVKKGFCCSYCGSSNPSVKDKELLKKLKQGEVKC